MLRLMDHPNIVKYYEHFEGKKGMAIVTEFVDGKDLHEMFLSRYNHGRRL